MQRLINNSKFLRIRKQKLYILTSELKEFLSILDSCVFLYVYIVAHQIIHSFIAAPEVRLWRKKIEKEKE